jgi:phenylpyruvate tautomerase PptA (4-oxalocrotonate tautomerase family)
MPVVRIESSIPLPAQTSRVDALSAVKDVILRKLGSKPFQVRIALYDVDPAATMVEGEYGDAAPPWVFVLAHIHEGRSPDERAAFVAELMRAVAAVYGVREAYVKVIAQEFADADWAFGR